MEEDKVLSDGEKETTKFLERDFNQCFMQMRYYDQQIFDIMKFLFGTYTTLTISSLGLFQFGFKEKVDMRLPATMALAVGIILGIFFLAVAVRNRAYFVQVSRYINEQRQFFIKDNTIGFNNKARMYTDPSLPQYFNRRSSQAWLIYILSFMNGLLLGILLYIALVYSSNRIALTLLLPLVLLVFQLCCVIRYLKGREGKSAETAFFGKVESIS